MPKMKTKKTVADRFKVTGTGKVMRRKIGQRHLQSHKSSANKRRNAHPVQVVGQLEKKVKKLLGI